MGIHLVLFSLLMVRCCLAGITISYSCLTEPDRFKIKASQDYANEYAAISAGLNSDKKCTFQPEKQVTNNFGLTFDPSLLPCGATRPDQSGNPRKWQVLVVASKDKQLSSTLVTGTTEVFAASCDFATQGAPTEFNVTSQDASFVVDGNITLSAVNASIPQVAMSVVCKDQVAGVFAKASVAMLGQECYLEGSFMVQGTAVGLQLNYCIVSPDLAIDNPVFKGSRDRYLIKNGCGAKGDSEMEAGILKKRKSFRWNGDKNVVQSLSFKAFRFAVQPSGGSGTVFLFCNIPICYDKQSCPQPNCDAPRRKKREIITSEEQPDLPESVNVLTAIQVLTNGDIVKSGRSEDVPNNKETDNTASGNCLDYVTFITVAAVFAFLFLMVIALAIFFCVKLGRQKQRERYVDQSSNQRSKHN